MVHSIRHLNYSDRLRELGLLSLQYRRARADLIEVYKILKGIDKCDKNKLFQTQPNQRLLMGCKESNQTNKPTKPKN